MTHYNLIVSLLYISLWYKCITNPSYLFIARQDFSYAIKLQFHRVFEFHPRRFFFVVISSWKNDIIKNIVSQKSGEKIGFAIRSRNQQR